MRNLMKLMAVLMITVASYTAANAQALKFGHIDLQALVQVMPERTAAEAEFNTFQGELEEILGEMQQDYQAKLAEFEAMGEAVSDIKRNAKIAEIQDVQQRIQNYQATAQQQVQQKQAELLSPVFDKAEKAIEEVAKEQGLIYVFDAGQGNRTILYKSNQSVDVLPLVKTKLGIQ
ncbi:OmpH family outer membrane protein [Draconibacterium halophilum]|uniref:OmpH family outer membrane protein n=1 Tax=Draconibacterium halophilum TaxID=2706887 RepID=A0A6C0RD84_9BACT|nr:OmpH family outer membrane protein [Draconibacterium halophilum]QIA08608.1 OmpH family outer membrane protein [Draconibacterium halophilum]